MKRERRTGNGAGGSGGAIEGMGRRHVLSGFGHLVMFEERVEIVRVAMD